MANKKKGIIPSHAQDNLREAGRAFGASCFNTFKAVITFYGALGISTPTVVSQPVLIASRAAAS